MIEVRPQGFFADPNGAAAEADAIVFDQTT
jgi:hypothetical protein